MSFHDQPVNAVLAATGGCSTPRCSLVADLRALAAQYGLEPLRDYKRRSRRHIDALRGEGIPC